MCKMNTVHNIFLLNINLGVGRNVPDPSQNETLSCGTVVPLGKETASNSGNTSLYYNEYIVYDVAQVRPRFLVKLKFDFQGSAFYF